jgi:hypothetical protein
MPSHDVLPTSSHGSVPHCVLCHGRLGVRRLARDRDGDGVRYWACDDCQVAWATRDAEDTSHKGVGWLKKKRA